MQPVTAAKTLLTAYVRLCSSLDPLWVISAMTLLSMVRFQEGAWFYSILYPVLLGLACLFPQVVRREQFWLVVCLCVGSSIVLNWYYIANHTFSLFYWTLALLLCCFAHDRLRMLALSARWILGFIFLFAFVWKLASPDFQSGATMRYFLSATQPLGASGAALSSLTGSELTQNMAAVERLLSTPGTGPTKLIMPPDLAVLADLLTRLTQITEGLVALILLTPLPERWRWLREASLLFFFATAYTLLPVAPFAAQFACLGYAMTASNRFRAAFIAAFFVYQLMDLRLGSLWGGS